MDQNKAKQNKTKQKRSSRKFCYSITYNSHIFVTYGIETSTKSFAPFRHDHMELICQNISELGGTCGWQVTTQHPHPIAVRSIGYSKGKKSAKKMIFLII